MPWPVWLVLGAVAVSLGAAALQAYRVLDDAGTTFPLSSEVADLPTRVAVLVQVIAPDRHLFVPLLGLVVVAGLLSGRTGTTPGHRPARLAASALAALVALGAGCLLGLLAYALGTAEAGADEDRSFVDERFLVFGGPSATCLVVLCVALLLVHHLVLTPAPVVPVDDPDQSAGSPPPQPGPGQVARVDTGPERDEQVVAVREEPEDPHAPFRRPH